MWNVKVSDGSVPGQIYSNYLQTSCQDFGYVVMSQLYSHVSIMEGGIKQTGTKTERE